MLDCQTMECFGTTDAGETASLYRLTNHAGAYVEILDYGCTIKGIWVPNRAGDLQNVALGCETLREYEERAGFGGVLLPGPMKGESAENRFARGMWRSVEKDENSVSFQRFHTEGETLLDMSVRFMWVDYNRLVIDLSVVPDADILLCPTSGILFRLSENDPSGEMLRLFDCTPLSAESSAALPVGALSFTGYRQMPDDLAFLSGETGIHPLAEWVSPESGISMSVYSTMRGLRIRRLQSPAAAQFMPLPLDDGGSVVPVERGTEFLHRIIYAFDPYKG